MSTTTLKLDVQRALGILNSRKTLTHNDIGKSLILTVQGNGTFQSAEEQKERDKATGKPEAKAYFDKYIFNLKANSAEAIARKENKALFSDAMKAEAAGNSDEADQLLREWLNNVQISFNMIADGNRRKFNSGDDIKAVVATAETSTGNNAIVVTDVYYQAPERAAKVTYNIADLLGEEAPVIPAAESATT